MDKTELKQILDGVSELLDVKLEAGLAPINNRLDSMDARLSRVELKQEVHDDNFGVIQEVLGVMNNRMDNMEGRMENMEGDIRELKHGLLDTQMRLATK